MKALEKLSNSESIRTFLDSISEENTLKKSFAAILPTFQKLGATTKDIENVLNNPTLMRSFVEGFDANSGTQELDKSSQPNAQGAPTIQDDDYFINQ